MKPNGHFPMSGIRLIRALAEQIEAEDLFDRQSAVVVGVSGGLDSTALLHALVVSLARVPVISFPEDAAAAREYIG